MQSSQTGQAAMTPGQADGTDQRARVLGVSLGPELLSQLMGGLPSPGLGLRGGRH